MLRLCVVACMIGCAADSDDKGAAGIDVDGSVSLIDRDGTADVAGVKAFGFNEGGRMGIMVSNNPDATCAGVAALLDGGGTVDPTDVYVAGTCHLWLSVADYDGGWSHTYVEGDEGYSKAVSSNVNCAMGDGAFELVDTVNGPGYQWTGDWWVGSPVAYDFDFSGGDGDDFEVDIRMTQYQGSFPLSDEFTTVLAQGEVSGGGVAKWCEAMGEASIF